MIERRGRTFQIEHGVHVEYLQLRQAQRLDVGRVVAPGRQRVAAHEDHGLVRLKLRADGGHGAAPVVLGKSRIDKPVAVGEQKDAHYSQQSQHGNES